MLANTRRQVYDLLYKIDDRLQHEFRRPAADILSYYLHKVDGKWQMNISPPPSQSDYGYRYMLFRSPQLTAGRIRPNVNPRAIGLAAMLVAEAFTRVLDHTLNGPGNNAAVMNAIDNLFVKIILSCISSLVEYGQSGFFFGNGQPLPTSSDIDDALASISKSESRYGIYYVLSAGNQFRGVSEFSDDLREKFIRSFDQPSFPMPVVAQLQPPQQQQIQTT